MPHPSVVRRATPEDHDDIWRLFLMGHRENSIFPLDHSKVEFLLQRALNPEFIHPLDMGPRAEIAVIGPKSKLEAMVFVIIGQMWYSYEYHLEELIVYVDPECRKSGHAKALIEWMKATADDMNVTLITGIISKDRTAAKIRLYDRYLPRIGAFFAYPIGNLDVKRKNHDMEKASWVGAQKKNKECVS